jgi:hypothetical protein
MAAYRLFFVLMAMGTSSGPTWWSARMTTPPLAATTFQKKKCQTVEVWEQARRVGRVDADITAGDGVS